MGIWSKLARCMTCKSSASSKNPRRSNTQTNSKSITRNINDFYLNLVHIIPSSINEIDSSRQDRPDFIPKILIKIFTNVNEYDIKVADSRPKDQDDTRYNCPICLKYFNRILKSDCCNNYICYFCCREINQCILNDKIKSAKCSFCCTEKFSVIDVDPNEVVRSYSDISSIRASLTSQHDNIRKSLSIKSRKNFLLSIRNLESSISSPCHIKGLDFDNKDIQNKNWILSKDITSSIMINGYEIKSPSQRLISNCDGNNSRHDIDNEEVIILRKSLQNRLDNEQDLLLNIDQIKICTSKIIEESSCEPNIIDCDDEIEECKTVNDTNRRYMNQVNTRYMNDNNSEDKHDNEEEELEELEGIIMPNQDYNCNNNNNYKGFKICETEYLDTDCDDELPFSKPHPHIDQHNH